jgi:hypothetical protein
MSGNSTPKSFFEPKQWETMRARRVSAIHTAAFSPSRWPGMYRISTRLG